MWPLDLMVKWTTKTQQFATSKSCQLFFPTKPGGVPASADRTPQQSRKLAGRKGPIVKNFILTLIAIVSLTFGCANEAQPLNTHGGNVPKSDCPTGGTSCSGEGSVCGENMCHCGTWMNRGNPACSQACTTPPPNAVCETGMACSGEGVVCASGNVCHCGRWTPPSLTSLECPGGTHKPTCNDLICGQGTHCEPQSNGGLACISNGGTGGSGGAPPAISCDTVTCPAGTHCSKSSGHIACDPDNTGGTSVGTHAVTIEVMSGYPVDHIWCEGAEVVQGNLSMDSTPGLFYEAWYSFGCDSFDGSYSCVVQVPNDRDLRFQCYLKAPENIITGDKVRYTCADPWMLHAGESFNVSRDGQSVQPALVQNLDPDKPGKNCQVD